MNRRILLVHAEEAMRETARVALGDLLQVHTASEGHEALELCERHGPFAAVVADHRLPTMDGVELMRRLHRGWPDTSRIMLLPRSGFDLAVEALHEGQVFRIVSSEDDVHTLRRAVTEGVDRFCQVEAERLLTEQLQFSRESLMGLTGILERRLDAQVDRMRELQRVVTGLTKARSVGEVARLAAVGCSGLLGGRAVRVRMEDSSSSDLLEEHSGASLAGETLSQAVQTADLRLGHIELDRLCPRGEPLSDHDQRILDSLVVYAGFAAENLIRRQERDAAQHTTIYALARLAENRDDETGRHLERVSEYCRLIAMGAREDGRCTEEITDGFISDLVLSAPLHDIGKVGIPDSILHKPGRLTEQEWAVMRTHSNIGAETLRHVLETSGEQSFLRMGHEIALHHHERWDGSGYPDGLVGEGISLASRIVALADCYDALTTWRPYKDPWSHERALEYIQEQRGSHFDPDLVEAFVRRAGRVNRIREELADDDREPIADLGTDRAAGRGAGRGAA